MFDLKILLDNPALAEKINITVSGSELLDFAKSLLTQAGPAEENPGLEDEIIPSKKLAEILDVSEVTLWSWDKKEITKPFFIGNRKYYRRQDIERIMKETELNKNITVKK